LEQGWDREKTTTYGDTIGSNKATTETKTKKTISGDQDGMKNLQKKRTVNFRFLPIICIIQVSRHM